MKIRIIMIFSLVVIVSLFIISPIFLVSRLPKGSTFKTWWKISITESASIEYKSEYEEIYQITEDSF